MAFVTEKQELKPRLVLFRRGDVKHRMWYCRLKMAGADRYKTISLMTEDASLARTRALDQEAELGLRLKYGIPVFTPIFREVGRTYLGIQEARARRGEISPDRVSKVRAVLEGPLDRYAGTTQVHVIAEERWRGYPAWRRENGAGRNRQNEVREIGKEFAEVLASHEAERRAKVQRTRGLPVLRRIAATISEKQVLPFVSDSTIRFEMSIFRAVLRYAQSKGYLSSSTVLDAPPRLKTPRRDAFTAEECQRLGWVAQQWIAEAATPSSWRCRTVVDHMIQIACNTGMRPGEMKHLRWRDIERAHDREGRALIVMTVYGKGRSRRLVAPQSVGDSLETIRALSRATEPNDRVFTNGKGEPARTLYRSLVTNLLQRATLREGDHGIPRSTYCLRHTYATLRLEAGVDVYLLAEQMGTSVQMIERHYGHIDIVQHADRLLRGMAPDPIEDE